MSADGENTVMSQQDIDAMMTSDVIEAAPAAEQASQAAPETPATAGAETNSGGEVRPPGSAADKSLQDVLQRLAKVEVTVAAGQQASQSQAQAMTQYLQALRGEVNQMPQQLQNTLAYGARASFQCSCGAQGLVASRVACTQCGRENWVGWWPQE